MPTRSAEARAQRSRSDHLYLVICAGKPIGGARWSLAGLDHVEIGRGATLAVKRSGRSARLDVPDPWMSTSHVRLERERTRWVAVDAGSRNGILISGAKHDLSELRDHDVVEAGRSFFMVRTAEIAREDELWLPKTDETGLLTLDPQLATHFDELIDAAQREVPVLLSGPTGIGKHRLARTVHERSRRTGDFVTAPCQVLATGVPESELFGHVAGAFPGAINDQPGLALVASGGTLYLDEIAALPHSVQADIIGAMTSNTVRALGSVDPVFVDLNIVAATRHVPIVVQEFRRQLVPLDGYEVRLPSLAERRVDLGLFLSEILPPTAQLAGVAARVILAHYWPGNLRELVLALERAVALARGGEIVLAYLPEDVAAARFPT